MSEDWFWNTEPRVVFNMINEKQRIDKEKCKLQAYYVACFISGQDPDENEQHSEAKKLPGVDVPVNENSLKSFMF